MPRGVQMDNGSVAFLWRLSRGGSLTDSRFVGATISQTRSWSPCFHAMCSSSPRWPSRRCCASFIAWPRITPAQMLSYNKMLGQLQDAGNTVTLAHYLELLSSAYLISGLNLWSGGIARQRASSPKLVTWNNALINSWPGQAYGAARHSPDLWGRLVENAVGGYLLNHLPGESIYYWRNGDFEVDYVLERAGKVLALEVKSGRSGRIEGLAAFQKRYPKAKALIVGSGGIPLERFSQRHLPIGFRRLAVKDKYEEARYNRHNVKVYLLEKAKMW